MYEWGLFEQSYFSEVIQPLWARGAGRCYNPACRVRINDTHDSHHVFISPQASQRVIRSITREKTVRLTLRPDPDDLVLLCADCQHRIDAATPGTYPAEMLKAWQAQHEDWVASGCSDVAHIPTTHALLALIWDCLLENGMCFLTHSMAHGGAAYAVWTARKRDTILPNNRRIARAVACFPDLLPVDLRGPAAQFCIHAEAFERHELDQSEGYPPFPAAFGQLVRDHLAKADG